MSTIEMERSPEPTEQPATEHDYLSTHRLEELRNAQHSYIHNAGMQAYDSFGDDVMSALKYGDTAHAEARAQAHLDADTLVDDYLKHHIDPDTNPEKYAAARELVSKYSVTNMDDTKWYHGEVDEDGRRIPGTSGMYQSDVKYDELVGMNARETPDPREATNAAVQTFRQAEAQLDAARYEMAKYSVRRRRRIFAGTKGSKALEANYKIAAEEYEKAYGVAAAHYVNVIQTAPVQPEGEADRDTRLRKTMLDGAVYELHNISAAEMKYLEQEGGKRYKVAKWLAERKLYLFGANAATGTALGVVGNVGARQVAKVAKTAAVIAAPIGAGIGVGAIIATRAARAAFQASVGSEVKSLRLHERRTKEDAEALAKRLNNSENGAVGPGELIGNMTKSIRESVDNRIEKDRKSNRNRVLGAMAISGGFALAAAGATEAYHHRVGPFHRLSNQRPAKLTGPDIPGPKTADTIPNGASTTTTPNTVPTPPASDSGIFRIPDSAITPSSSVSSANSIPTLQEQAVNALPKFNGATAANVANSANVVITPNLTVTPGAGMIQTLENGFHMSRDEAAYAHQMLIDQGMYDAANIPGAELLNGQVANYLSGSGDGTYHFSAAAQKVIQQAHNTYKPAA